MAHHQHRPQLAPSAVRPRANSDPLAKALLPPPDETPAERENRLRMEEEAKKRSEYIDRMLRQSAKEQRRKKVVKILLLGQSESGKSTTLKQFQLLHTPEAFHAERIAWRFVIYLNLVRSIRRILEAITPEIDPSGGFDDYEDADPSEAASIIITGRPSSSFAGTTVPGFESYRKRLAPLLELEHRLIQQLSDPEDSQDYEATHLPPSSATHYGSQHPTASSSYASTSTSAPSWHTPTITIPPVGAVSSPASPTSRSPHSEVSVHHTSSWKKILALGNKSPKSPHSGELSGWWEDPYDPVHVLNRCAPTMMELWRDPKVRQRLAEKRLRLEESSGFYLDEIERVTMKMYFPTDEDVLKARLKTTGVIEHVFSLPKNSEFHGVEWRIYDVGGARPQRHAWQPYFDDVNAIIFLAPISAFDQVLAEDPNVNRLEDTVHLWQMVVKSPLLSKVNIILFLNKCDLLKRKLANGVKLSHFMTTYDGPNDYQAVSNYFKYKFGALHQQLTPNKERECYVHLTSVTDTRTTRMIISNVRDIILAGNLRSSALM